jgi:hypothetical protein
MKSRDDNDMLQAWRAALFDAASRCMIPTPNIARDYERVRKGLATRGQKFLTLDLPLLDETLLDLLEHGFVGFKGILRRRRSKKDSRPAFLNAFWSLVCDPNGCLLEEPDADAILSIRQLACLFKKLAVPCSQARTANAVGDFYEIENSIPLQPARWSEDSLNPDECRGYRDAFGIDRSPDLFEGGGGVDTDRLRFLERLDRVAQILVSELGSFDPESENSPEHGFFKHGPGAVSNLGGSEYKYSFPSWPRKLAGVFDFGWTVGELDGHVPLDHEHPSNLLAVPKTAKSPRLIASEPVEHQWCQQKIYTWLDGAIHKSTAGSFINLHDQTLSQDMVIRASIDRSLCTIDLSSASDRITCQHVESLLRANHTLLLAAHAVRTRYVKDRVTSSGFHLLRKYSTMGSALTFPIQCLFFLAVVLASAGATSKKDILRLRKSVRVFGDDIIAPNDAYDQIVTNLTFLGLKVNVGKSFHRGHFRESCGADYWRGYNVTPIKPKVILARTPDSWEAVRDTANNFHREGWWNISSWLYGLFPPRFRKEVVVPLKDKDRLGRAISGVPAFVAFSAPVISHAKWDRHLHRWYVTVSQFVKKMERVRQDNSCALREFFSKPYVAEQPRVTGTQRRRAAVIAALRVEVIPLGEARFSISS